jgi:hypothetical protein
MDIKTLSKAFAVKKAKITTFFTHLGDEETSVCSLDEIETESKDLMV